MRGEKAPVHLWFTAGVASRGVQTKFFRKVLPHLGLALPFWFFQGRSFPMSIHPVLPPSRGFEPGRLPTHTRKSFSPRFPSHYPAHTAPIDAPNRQAELFYLQKQIQSQTPMVIVLEDGERIDGCIEWYDRNTIKTRGRFKILIYKSAIKYMYKLGDNG
jgi:sRNA-binding regulator protein Hfq